MEEAEKSASALMKLTVFSGAVGGLIVLAAMPFVLRFANLTETGRGFLKGMLLINTYYVMGQAVNTTLIAGVFRAGGDSRFGFICDTIDMWLYAVPLGFLSAAVFKLPPMWVYFLLCTDEFVKWPWVIGHYRSKKWLRNITRENVV
jgi:Na+-driven multidrug efflux pump